MNQTVILGQNSTHRRVYQRRNRKGNRTLTSTLPTLYVPLVTTVVTSNTTLLLNSSSVPVQDLFAPLAYFIQYKYFFLIGLCLLLLLCVLTVIFFVIILRCARGKSGGKPPINGGMTKRFSDFFDKESENHEANISLLDPHDGAIALHNTSGSNGILPNDNISTTYSLDPVLVQKIIQNNPPNTNATSAHADDMSLNTLRGSLVSTPSQQIPAMQPTTPVSAPPLSSSSLPYDHRNSITTTDSITNHDERVVDAEKDDDLQDLDLKPITQHYIKANNRSTGNLANVRNSTSTSEVTIRGKEKKEEELERAELHGSKTNIYVKEMKRQEAQEAMDRRQHTNSQVSLVSRTSEDSCY